MPAYAVGKDSDGVMNDLVRVLYTRGKYALAEEYCRRWLAHEHAELTANYLLSGIFSMRLGLALSAQGRHEEALECCTRAANAFAKAPPDYYMAALSRLGKVLTLCGKFAEAEQNLRRALRMVVEMPEEEDWHAFTLVYLAQLLLSDGTKRFAEAAVAAEKALEIYSRIFSDPRPEIASALHIRGMLYAAEKDIGKAVECLERALQLRTEILGSDHPDTITTQQTLASLRA